MSITGANVTYMFGVTTIFPSPVQLKGFAADDSFMTTPQRIGEVLMGVDGNQSGGFVYVSVEQEISLQADSPSVPLFDQWVQAEYQVQDAYQAFGTIIFPSIGKKFTMTQGILLQYPPMPGVKRLLQPLKYMISWGRAVPSPI
jgi:hypothetical protein